MSRLRQAKFWRAYPAYFTLDFRDHIDESGQYQLDEFILTPLSPVEECMVIMWDHRPEARPCAYRFTQWEPFLNGVNVYVTRQAAKSLAAVYMAL